MKKCKNCEVEFVQIKTLQYLCSPKCDKEYSKKRKENRKDIRRKQDYEKLLEIIFNRFIRERDKDKPCISCGEITPLVAGHFYPVGSYKNLRFDEHNVHGQCMKCNGFNHGDLKNYKIGLINRIGQDNFDNLVERSRVEAHFTSQEILAKTNKYKKILQKMQH